MNDIELNKKLINLMESTMVEKKESKPDFADIDGDGNKEETMKKAAKDKDKDKPKGKKPKKGEVPPQFKKGKKEESINEADEKMPSKAEVMKCCKDGMSASEICKKYPDCDQAKLKELCKTCKEEHKEKQKTDESFNKLAESLRSKLDAMMNESEVSEAHPGPKTEPSKQKVKCKDADGKEYTKTVTAVNPTAASKDVQKSLPKGHTVMSAVKVTESPEELDEAEVAEMAEMRRMAGLEEQTASTSSMPKKSAPVLDNEGVNGYEGYMVGEEEETDEAVLDEAELDEMAEMMRMAGISEEDDAERDDHAEKAGLEVAHDMEYDDEHDASDDDHDEEEGRHVAKDIEFDEKEHEAMKSILQKLMK